MLYFLAFLVLWVLFGALGVFRLYRHALHLEELLMSYHNKEVASESMHLSANYMMKRTQLIEENILFFKMIEQKRTTPFAFYVGSIASSIVLGPILFIRT